jgi:hypothetical protein
MLVLDCVVISYLSERKGRHVKLTISITFQALKLV